MWKAKKLQCKVQHYEWGKHGGDCHVGRLYSLLHGHGHGHARDHVPYAELWMGTHDSGHSILLHVTEADADAGALEQMIPLRKWLQMHPQLVGDQVLQRWAADLPFLFKVLSVGKALSIQAHPDKQLAAILHQSQPDVYKDANHKPEMAVALTEFEALCGFVSMKELKEVVEMVPEMGSILGKAEEQSHLGINGEDQDNENAEKTLRSDFTKLMALSKEAVKEAIGKMKKRLAEENQVRALTQKEKLVLRLEKQYPDDIGVLAAFFLNYVKLSPGEALYLDANEPHAYLYGECVECMATSDNVVRAGLTPKYRDVDTLCSMLTYKQGFPDILQGCALNPFTTRYSPPFDEFEVDRCILPSGSSVTFPPNQGPSIFLVLHGKGSMVQWHGDESSINGIGEGDVFFFPAGTGCELSATVENNGCALDAHNSLHIYRAGVNSRVFRKGT